MLKSLVLALLIPLAAQAAPPSPEAVRALAPTGVLRAAINFGNPVLAQRDPATGQPRGVSVALATELSARLGVPLAITTYDEAGRVAAAAADGIWDIAFLAIDPVRAATIDYTSAYVIIEGVYVVPGTSPLQTPQAVDAPGQRITVAKDSAYDLYLSRSLKNAELVRFPGGTASEAAFLGGGYDAIAGVREAMVSLVQRHSGLRQLPGSIMTINQAMAVSKGREAGLAYLSEFVENAKRSGFVRRALDESGQDRATVAPGR